MNVFALMWWMFFANGQASDNTHETELRILIELVIVIDLLIFTIGFLRGTGSSFRSYFRLKLKELTFTEFVIPMAAIVVLVLIPKLMV